MMSKAKAPQSRRQLSRRDFLKLGSTLALASPLVLAAADQPPVIWHGDQATSMLALTFDDCYSYTVLRQMERELIKHPFTRVTFFPVGQAVQRHSEQDPGIWKRLVSRGHEIGYHTFSHQFGSSLSTDAMIADYQLWIDAVSQSLGHTPPVRFARPPYADMSRSFMEMCAEMDLAIAMWSAEFGLKAEITEDEVATLKGGDIVLFHMGPWDLDNLRFALPHLTDFGLQMVTMSAFHFPTVNPLKREEVLCTRGLHRCLKP